MRNTRRRLGQPEDFEDWDLYDDIKSEIESAIERMADNDAAAAWSTLGDQDLMDLEEAGYDDRDAISIAWFGNNGVAVGGDVLVDPWWEKTLKYKRKKHPQLWGDVDTGKLIAWLGKNGYERVDRLGGEVPTTEQEVQMDHVLNAVARELEVDPSLVKQVAAYENYGDYYYTSSNGDVEVYAKPVGD